MGLYTTVKTKGAKWTFSSLNTSWTLVPWAQSSGDLELLRIVIFTLFRDGCKVAEEKQKLLWLKLYSASVLLDHKSHLNILGLQVVCIVCYTLLLLCILLSLIIQTPLITTKPKDSQTSLKNTLLFKAPHTSRNSCTWQAFPIVPTIF